MPYSRRSFLKTTAVAVAGASLFDVREFLAAGPHTYTRLDVGPMTASSPALVSYAKAINEMKKRLLPADPLSWAYQAAIHGTETSGSYAAWNSCEHGTPYFWAWHRMYLYWFERIIRKMSNDDSFALPYWNYQSDTQRHLPAPFRDPASPLYTAERGAGWNEGTAHLKASAVKTDGFMAVKAYYTAQGDCGFTPHATVHGSILGWMGSTLTAAQDPIFYLHHANIDRWWNLWLKQGGHRSNPLKDTAWMTKKFLFFDENRKQRWMTGCDVLRCAQQLDYTYENEGTQVDQDCTKPLPWYVFEKEYLIEWPPIKLPPGPDPGPFAIDVRELRQRLLAAASDATTDVSLELEGIEADRQPNVFWEVYVGLPRGATPRAESAHYVGNVALFGHGIRDEHHQHGGFRPAEVSFQVDRAVQSALQRDPSGKLDLLLVASGAQIQGQRAAGTRNEVNLTIGKARLALRRLKEV